MRFVRSILYFLTRKLLLLSRVIPSSGSLACDDGDGDDLFYELKQIDFKNPHNFMLGQLLNPFANTRFVMWSHQILDGPCQTNLNAISVTRKCVGFIALQLISIYKCARCCSNSVAIICIHFGFMQIASIHKILRENHVNMLYCIAYYLISYAAHLAYQYEIKT